MIHHIRTIRDVHQFIKCVALEIDNFHPLVEFQDYTRPDSYFRRYTDGEAETRNELLEQCFNVCAGYTPDFFTYLLELFQNTAAHSHHQLNQTI